MEINKISINPNDPLDPFYRGLPKDSIQWLNQLQQPTWLQVKGKQSDASRLVTTLLHGNEPSGLYGIHEWLKRKTIPFCDLHFLIASVEAALKSPQFSHRMLPEHRDLNRCFRPPFDDRQGEFAKRIINEIIQLQPECVVDIHNTSGTGPSFAVATSNNNDIQALTQLFCQRLIVTDFRLGSLMEVEAGCPIVTIECGGAKDSESTSVALEGIERLAKEEVLFDKGSVKEVLINPIRVELKPDASIAYNQNPMEEVDVTLFPEIEHCNVGITKSNTKLGWVGKRGLFNLQAIDGNGQDQLENLLAEEHGWLKPKQSLRIFMATTNADIAKSDCLFYAVPSES